MRIGLDFRFLSVGRQNVVRGIPRFTQEQVQSVLALDHDSTYLLLCDPGDDLRAIRPEIRKAANVRIVCAPDSAPPAFSRSDDTRTLLARYAAYQRWIETLRLDLYHATCHFWISRLLLPGFDACPYVATAYDLMPLLYPVPVQGEPEEAYQRGLRFLQQATRVAAISQATADGVVQHVGIPAERIDLTRPAISPCFRPIPREVTRAILASLEHPARRGARRCVRVPPEYVLAVTDLHYTKNISTLLAAYAQLPAVTRSHFPLVVAGHLARHDVAVLERYARSLGIESDLVLTGRVSDHELMALYNGATILVHPSHHEGFGLTVAEAMRCGTPVITTTRASLPEVTGDAAVLVDSEDAAAFTEAIDILLRDRDLRNDLARRGRVQAARFSTTCLGESTLACYRNALSTLERAASNITRVAFWSPITPQASDAAEYTTDLLTGLAGEPGLQLDVFVGDGVMPPLDLLRVARVHHWSDFDRSARQSVYDATIYQHGASPLHHYMERAMRMHPGIVVLHDLPRDDLVPVVDGATCCVALTPEAASEVHRHYAKAAARVIPVGVRDPREDGPGFDRVMARAYLGLDHDAFVVVAIGPVAAATRLDSVVDAVANLRHSGVDALLVIAGWTEDDAYASALRSRAATLNLGAAFRLTEPVPSREFDACLAASDAVVALGDGGPLRTAGAVLRAFAAGRCVVVSDGAGAAATPETVCIRVAAPPNERADLSAALSRLAEAPEERQALERRARAHYEATGRLDEMVEGYVALIREQAGGGRPRAAATASNTHAALDARPAPRPGRLPYSKACELDDFAHPDLREVLRAVRPHKRAAFGGYPRGHEHREDWEAAMAVRTLADHGALRADARILGVAPGTPDVLLHLTWHAGEVVAVDTRELPAAQRFAGSFDGRRTAPLEAPFAFRADRLTVRRLDPGCLDYPDEYFDGIAGRIDCHPPAALLAEMQRVLKPGGVLSLSMDLQLGPDPWSEASRPDAQSLSASEVEQLIAGARTLEAIGAPRLSVSHWTLSTVRDVATATAAWRARRAAQPEGSQAPGWALWDMPHIVLAQGGCRYTSVHLALRRSAFEGLPEHP